MQAFRLVLTFTIFFLFASKSVSAQSLISDHLKTWKEALKSSFPGTSQGIHDGRTLLVDSDTVMGRTMVINGARIPAWRGRLDTKYGISYIAPAMYLATCNDTIQNCSAVAGQRYPYNKVVIDPTNPGSRQPVLQITYPQNGVNPSNVIPGGFEGYFYPYKNNPNLAADPFSTSGATLEYDLYVPPDFQFQKGGKLPGMGGGGTQYGRGCSGGDSKGDTCFSYRLMFHRQGVLQLYLYLPRANWDPDFCNLPRCYGNDTLYPCDVCDQTTGIVLGRATANLTAGAWTSIRMVMRLNTPNVSDGYVALWANNVKAYEFSKVLWRVVPDVFIENMMFSTFFGGNSPEWASPVEQSLYFKNIRMFYDGPSDPLLGPRGTPRPPMDGPASVVYGPPEKAFET